MYEESTGTVQVSRMALCGYVWWSMGEVSCCNGWLGWIRPGARVGVVGKCSGIRGLFGE